MLTCCSCQPHSGKLPVLFHTLRTSLPMPCRGGSTARHQPCLQSPLLSLCYGSTQPSKLPGSQPRKPAPSWQVLATPASASFPECLVSIALRLGAASGSYCLCWLRFLFLTFYLFDQFLKFNSLLKYLRLFLLS